MRCTCYIVVKCKVWIKLEQGSIRWSPKYGLSSIDFLHHYQNAADIHDRQIQCRTKCKSPMWIRTTLFLNSLSIRSTQINHPLGLTLSTSGLVLIIECVWRKYKHRRAGSFTVTPLTRVHYTHGSYNHITRRALCRWLSPWSRVSLSNCAPARASDNNIDKRLIVTNQRTGDPVNYSWSNIIQKWSLSPSMAYYCDNHQYNWRQACLNPST